MPYGSHERRSRCVHSNLGALYETASRLTLQYQFQEDTTRHAKLFGHMLDAAIRDIDKPELQSSIGVQKGYARAFYSIDSSAQQFENLIRGLLNEPREIVVLVIYFEPKMPCRVSKSDKYIQVRFWRSYDQR